jgi:hypothetical protein
MTRRPSTVDRLPPEIRELIGTLLEGGHTLDEILAKLGELDVDVSRSALGRYSKRIVDLGADMLKSRAVAEALVKHLGDQPDDKVARLNLELLHTAVFSILTTPTTGENGEDVPLVLAPADAKALSEVMRNLTSAAKTDTDRAFKIRAEAKKEAVAAVEKVAKQGGLSKETVETITRAVLGVE